MLMSFPWMPWILRLRQGPPYYVPILFLFILGLITRQYEFGMAWEIGGDKCKARRSISRVLSLTLGQGATIHLGRLLPDASRDRPGRRRGSAFCFARRQKAAVPIWSCSRWGLPCRLRCRGRGALLPHPFTLTASKDWRFAFCGTFPRVTPAGRYPAPYFRGARTFLSGLPRSGRPTA